MGQSLTVTYKAGMGAKFKRFAINMLKTLLLPILIIGVFGLLTRGRSLSPRMLMVTLRQSVQPAIISMALLGNLQLGMWDFSSGGVVVATAIIGGNLMNMTGTGTLGLMLFTIILGVLMTTLTGFLNNKLRVPTIVLTIGLVLIYEMLPRILFDAGATIRPKFGYLASSPYCFYILAVMFVIFYLLNNKTAYGHNIRALGGSHDIAVSAGLNADRIKQVGFTVSGIFLGTAGLLHMSASGQILNVAPLGSVATIFEAMMGVFLAFFLSKYCNIAIALIVGTFTMTALTNNLVALGVSATARSILTGAFLLVLMTISANQGRIAKWREDKKRAEEANAKYIAGAGASMEN